MKHLYPLALLLLLFQEGLQAQQTLSLSTYNGENEIVASESITLLPGFHVPQGSNVRIYISAAAAACVPLASAPTAGQNYILTNTYQQAFANAPASPSTCEIIQQITYYDGLGRPMQAVSVKGAPNHKDLVTPVAYDAYGRQARKYLPYATTTAGGGGFKSNTLSAQASYYNSTPPAGQLANSKAFAETIFEPSPLNRIKEQGFPGTTWQPAASRTSTAGRTIVTEYTVNNETAFTTLSTTRRVAKYGVSISAAGVPSLTLSGAYATGTLRVTVTKDENWVSSDGRAGTMETYTDKKGQVVLKRVFNKVGSSLEMLSTYYVYDDFGRLTFALPPGRGTEFNPDRSALPTATMLNNFCYQYRYDERNRMIEKKLPAKGWEYLVYNKLDQVVATQDALQRSAKQWLITKYDGLGRVALTGIWDNGNTAITRANVQTQVNAQSGSNHWEERTGTGIGYTNRAWPTSSVSTTLTLHYYDDYEIPGIPSSYDKAAEHSRMTRGLATATRIKVLNVGTGTSNMLWNVPYYDDKGRVVRQFNQHYKGAGTANANNYDEILSQYTFTGRLTESTRRHYTAGSLAVTLKTEHTYDHQGRLLDTWKTVNSDTRTLIARQAYNEVGQLRSKKLHSTNETSYAQTLTYDYNPRGWLRKTTSPLFTQELRYTEGTSKQYNGNIAYQLFTRYNTADSPTLVSETYTYTYDKVNRLLSGTMAGSKGKEALSYDRMGNIESLQRSGTSSTLVDNLSYAYSAGRLSSVTDASANTATVYQLSGTTTLTYDGNGNLKTRTNSAHSQKNITAISYNHLNLPRTITTATGNITYTYDATGRKLRSVNAASGQTRDYIDGIEYEGGTLELIHMEEGRIVKSGSSYQYEYLIKDHLGNSRVGFLQSSGPATLPNFTADYYPFGLQYQADIRQPSPENKYLYNSKELQEGIGWYDYGARFYDPVVGRWGSVDPLSELNKRWSTYNYAANNPIRHIDPDGMDIIDINGGVRFTGVDAVYAFFLIKDIYQSTNPTAAPNDLIGTTEYYKWRNADFKKRHEGTDMKSPSYYLEYGDKYVNKFRNETYYKLSFSGQLWLLKALVNLQRAIEEELINNPTIEENDEEFSNFAFNSHIPAYVNAGFLKLSVLDKVTIGLTPDPKDLFNSRGIAQAVGIGNQQLDYYKRNPDFAAAQMLEANQFAPQIISKIAEYVVKYNLNSQSVISIIGHYLPQK